MKIELINPFHETFPRILGLRYFLLVDFEKDIFSNEKVIMPNSYQNIEIEDDVNIYLKPQRISESSLIKENKS